MYKMIKLSARYNIQINMKKINYYYSQLLSNTWANLALKTIIWGLLTGLLMLIIRGILFIYADELKTPLTKPPEMLPYP